MDITDKIDSIINEATVPSQQGIRSEMAKGLKDVPDITGRVAMALYHYFDLKIVKGKTYGGSSGSNMTNTGLVFKSQSSNKLADELWYRIGKNVEDSEMLSDDGLKKLKKNFYGIVGKWSKVYSFDNKANAWRFIG